MSLPPNPQAAQQYLRTKVLTATPEQLQMMLYDGALRYGEQARVALQKKKYDESYTMISRVQKILCELTGSLKQDMAPDLCKNLAALYNFAHRRLVTANLQHDITALDEGMQVLRYQRDTWALLMQQLGQQKAATAAQKLDFPAPNQRMEASFSMKG